MRKTLLISFPLISEDLVRQKLSYEPGCPENLTLGTIYGGSFSSGLLDFRLFVRIFESGVGREDCTNSSTKEVQIFVRARPLFCWLVFAKDSPPHRPDQPGGENFRVLRCPR